MKFEIKAPELRQENVLILRRNNLIVSAQEKAVVDISYNDIARDIKPLYLASIALFIDEDGTTRLLKNRYGFDGMVISENKYRKCQDSI